jgi:hypothetical protein
MFGNILGKIVALPVRVANIPAKLFDRLTDAATDGDSRTSDFRTGAPLDAVADEIEQLGRRLDGGK